MVELTHNDTFGVATLTDDEFSKIFSTIQMLKGDNLGKNVKYAREYCHNITGHFENIFLYMITNSKEMTKTDIKHRM